MKAGAKTAKSSPAKSSPAKKKAAPAPKRAAAAKRPPAPSRPAGRAPAPRHVGDVMTREPVTATVGDSLRDVARLLDEYEISGVPVLDDQERLIGVISRTDLLRRLLEGPAGARRDEEWLDLLSADSTRTVEVDAARLGTVDDVMSIDPIVAKENETLATVARRMAEDRVHRLVVVDERKRPIGIVTTLDLLRVFPT